MIPIDSTNDQNAMRRVISGYMHTLTVKIRIKEKNETALSFLSY